MLPQDPIILLSYINMKLRDECISLQEFCKENDVSEDEIVNRLSSAGFIYDPETNQFR